MSKESLLSQPRVRTYENLLLGDYLMVTEKRRIKLTYEDYLSTPDDKRYELLDGELVLAPAPRTTHQRTLLELTLTVGRHVKDHSLGEIFTTPTDVFLTDTDVVQPDLSFISRERAGIITELSIQGAPDLISRGALSIHCESRSRIQADAVRPARCERVLDGWGRVGDHYGVAAW